jgi:membrane fusion protein (multidrug efflux system)
MKKIFTIIPLALVLLLNACSKGEATTTDSVEQKLEQISQYKSEIKGLEIKIQELEKEIIASGGSLELPPDTIPVTVLPVVRSNYEEFVEVAGTVSSDKNILVSSEVGGTVTALMVQEGQTVSAGQILLTTDDQILLKSIDELESAFNLAKTVYEKRKSLWDQNIGSEIEYLTAKNNMENLELRLNTTRSQWAKTQLRAPITGVVDEVITKKGEMAAPGMPLLRVVNLSEVKIECDVSEAYVGKLKRGDKVQVAFPSIGMETAATIRSVGQVINPGNRTFSVEVTLSNPEGVLKPNLLGYVKIREFIEPDQVVIPTKYVQNGVDGPYVLTVKDGVITKNNIQRGRSHNGQTQVLSGLNGGETLVAEGYRDAQPGDIAHVVELQTASME